MLARDGEILTATDDYACTVTAMTAVRKAPHPRPEGYLVDMARDGYRVRGTVRVTRVFQNEDVLANLSWPVRLAVKAFYAKPWLFRMRGEYDLEVDLRGEKRRIRGNTLLVLVGEFNSEVQR